MLFGIGGGWNAEEMGHHGTDFDKRWKVLRERIAAMQEIWTKDEAEYHGKFVNFDKLWSYPKPVQKPHPPILMGGAGPHARQRAVDFGGHWLPIGGRSYSEPMAETIADLRARAEKAGQDPGAVTISIFGAPTDEARLAGLRDAGVLRAIFGLPVRGARSGPPAPRQVRGARGAHRIVALRLTVGRDAARGAGGGPADHDRRSRLAARIRSSQSGLAAAPRPLAGNGSAGRPPAPRAASRRRLAKPTSPVSSL